MGLTKEEIAHLLAQLKAKKAEVKAIYDKLALAGVIPLSEEILEMVVGGAGGSPPPTSSSTDATLTASIPTYTYGPR